ncbi:methylmalonyl-CoA mutase family protein, partial [Bacteriovoracaceae bacterium]|nr:methylmalonyl-CoA mutase family protein [Bacteriovoracaceae bacterium]
KGIPKLNIEKSAAIKQAKIDKGIDTIVGVNKYKLEKEDDLEILSIDNEAVLKSQIERLNQLRTNRDQTKVDKALVDLESYAQTGEGNSLDLAVKAARAKCSVGEITYALEKHWGRYNATSQTVSGVYGQAYESDEDWKVLKEDIDKFIEDQGRRPRMLVAKMGQDGHDRGAKVIATAFADIGFDIDLAPLFSTPAEVAKQAIENDVHVVGVSSQAAGHKTLVPDLIKELKKLKAEDIIVVVGGVIPKQDYDFLSQAGVKGIFGPGTPILESARAVLKEIKKANK